MEEVAKAVGGGYCRLRMPLKLAFVLSETVAGHRLGAGYFPPFQCSRPDVQNSGGATFLVLVKVHVVKGCVTHTADLHRASVHTALRVLILNPIGPSAEQATDMRSSTTDSSKGMAPESHGDCLEDCGAVMGLLAIEESLQMMDGRYFRTGSAPAPDPTTLSIAEVRHRRSMRLLKPQAMYDGILSHMFFNYTPRFAAGLIVTPIINDVFLTESVYNDDFQAIVNQLLSNLPTSAFLAQVPVPRPLAGMPYHEVFAHLARNNMVALGLYRYNGGGNLPFVYTNPPQDAVVQQEDMVFVVRRGQPSL